MLSIDQFEDLIRYENEGTFLDFKAIQYKKDVHVTLVKDVLAMANAAFDGEKYIIIGVKVRADGTREFPGIQDDFVDEATYQQLIHANIEPEIPITYSPVHWEEKLYGVFTIKACTDKPYMMRRAYTSSSTSDASAKMLRAGEMWIRKGSSQFPVLRRDLDNMLSIKRHVAEEQVSIVPLSLDETSNKILIPRRISLPSEEEAERIKKELDKQKKGQSTPVSTSQDGKFIIHRLAHKSEAELFDELKRVKKTFESEDLHSRFEKNGVRLNFILTNSGEQYLKDVTVLVTVSADKGLEIAPKVYKEFSAMAYPALNADAFSKVHIYPDVRRHGEGYVLEQYLSDIKHHIPQTIFINDLRMSIDEAFAGKCIAFDFKLMAENLPKPIEKRFVVETMLKPLT
jgi:hypothetical protein